MATFSLPSNDTVSDRVLQGAMTTGATTMIVSSVTNLNTNGGYLTIDPGVAGKQEVIHYSGFVVLTREVTVDVRGITITNGTYGTSTGTTHADGAEIIISDNALDLYSLINHDLTFAGTKTFSGTVDLATTTISALTIDGNWTAASQTCANLGTVSAATSITTSALVATTADINAGTVDNATIGVSTPAAANFTTIGATTRGTAALTYGYFGVAGSNYIQIDAEGGTNGRIFAVSAAGGNAQLNVKPDGTGPLRLDGDDGGSAGSISMYINNTQKFWLASSGYFGFGITPTYPLHISTDMSALSASNPTLLIEGANNKERIRLYSVGGTGATGACGAYEFRHARGTIASPTATQSADRMGFIGVSGYGATAATGNAARMEWYATENYTDAATGTAWRNLVTPTGSITPASYLTLVPATGLDLPVAGTYYSREGVATTQKIAWGWNTGVSGATQTLTLTGFTNIHRVEFHAVNETSDDISFGSTDGSSNYCITTNFANASSETTIIDATASAVYTSWAAPTLTITWTGDGTEVFFIWYAFGY